MGKMSAQLSEERRMLEEIFSDLGPRMEKALGAVQRDFNTIRTGRANPALLDNVSIDYFGTPTKISHVAAISTPDSQTLLLNPWDKTMIQPIEKAIQAAALGLNPGNDGNTIRISIPSLTEERRRDLVRQVKKFGEDGKIRVRNVRRDINDHLKKSKNEGEIGEDELKKALERVQKTTDQFIHKVDELISEKEAEILTV